MKNRWRCHDSNLRRSQAVGATMWPIEDTIHVKVVSGESTPCYMSHFRTPTPRQLCFAMGVAILISGPGQSHTLMSVIPQLPEPVIQGINRVTVEHKTVKKEAISVLPSSSISSFLAVTTSSTTDSHSLANTSEQQWITHLSSHSCTHSSSSFPSIPSNHAKDRSSLLLEPTLVWDSKHLVTWYASEQIESSSHAET
jgi:hypothetical protein